MEPKLICLTPVRNEAWILHAFLKATSLWADYIIIADQGSTDGSREIALSYPKVILIDNNRSEMHQAQTRKLLFEEARKIGGSKVLFALDADEFLSGDFMQTESWQKIIRAKQNDVFCFRWINITENPNKAYFPDDWMYWVAGANNGFEVDTAIFPDNDIHEWRLPYPTQNVNELCIDDIKFIHFARYNTLRQRNKNVFYQVFTKYKHANTSFISLFRSYHNVEKAIIEDVSNEIFSYYSENKLDILSLINLEDVGKYYIDESNKMIASNPHLFRLIDYQGSSLDISQHTFNISFMDRLILKYLKHTQSVYPKLIIRLIDKFLKKCGF